MVRRDPDRLGPGTGAGLADGGRQVVAHRSLGQVLRRGDVGHGAAVPGSEQHLMLASGQRTVTHGKRLGRQRGVDHAQPGMDARDRIGELAGVSLTTNPLAPASIARRTCSARPFPRAGC